MLVSQFDIDYAIVSGIFMVFVLHPSPFSLVAGKHVHLHGATARSYRVLRRLLEMEIIPRLNDLRIAVPYGARR